MLQHTLHPRSIRCVLLDNDCIREMKRFTFHEEKFNFVSSKVSPLTTSWLQSTHYTNAFSDRHHGALVAFPSSRSVVILDGHYNGPLLWEDWVIMFVWKLTGKRVKIVYHNESRTYAWVAALRGEDAGDSTSWNCYIASDAIDQGRNGTECGFLACMNVM